MANELSDKLNSVKDSVVSFFGDFKNRIIVIALFIGSLLLLAKFRDVLADVYVYLSKRDLKKATEEDQKLAQDEKKANDQANVLVDEAKRLATDTKPETDLDWNKK